MLYYKNLNGNSAILRYELMPDSIAVEFSSGKQYTYSYQSAGSVNIEHMKKLATIGSGLNAFIIKMLNFYTLNNCTNLFFAHKHHETVSDSS